MPDPDPKQDDLAEEAADLILDAEEQYQQRQAEQEEFLDTVAEEADVPVVEAQCNIIGEYVVPIKAELDGELTDRLGDMEARLERLDNGEGHAYEMSEAADEASQMLADIVDDPSWHKGKFYKAYENTNIDGLSIMLENVFEVVKRERERAEGAADGFRQK